MNPTDETLCYYESEKEVVPRKSYEVGHILKVDSRVYVLVLMCVHVIRYVQ